MANLQKIWTEKFNVNWYDTDLNGRIKMSAVANYLQETAWRHANHLGFGFEDAQKRNEFWVVVGMMIRLSGSPEWGQTISVTTWPKGIDRLFAFRDYKIMNSEGSVLGAATSTWMILDQDTRRPKSVDIVRPVLHMASMEHSLQENAPFLLSLKKISSEEMRQVRFSEVDQYGHVNNIRYLDWCLDALSSEWHSRHRISSLVINYLSEVRADETMKIATGPEDEHSLIIQGTREGDGKVIFRTRIGWEI